MKRNVWCESTLRTGGGASLENNYRAKMAIYIPDGLNVSFESWKNGIQDETCWQPLPLYQIM